jgi:hypothetical protein
MLRISRLEEATKGIDAATEVVTLRAQTRRTNRVAESFIRESEIGLK